MKREDLAELTLFLAVVEEGGFTRAAQKLNLTQSAVSHAIRRLEARLGLRLLTRTTRSVAPTDAGERLIETLRPALEDIDARLTALTALRERPAGTIRITCSEHAADTVLWPAVHRLTTDYPDIQVELFVDAALTDIVAERFDAGVRLGERLEQDMIATPIGPRLRMAVVGSPGYFDRCGRPRTPHDLAQHACINLRLTTGGGLYPWEFEKEGRAVNVRVGGPFVFNRKALMLAAAVEGHGLAFAMEDQARPFLEDGRLERVLDDWCEPFDGYHLYYPSRRQPSAAFSLLLQALRYRTPAA